MPHHCPAARPARGQARKLLVHSSLAPHTSLTRTAAAMRLRLQQPYIHTAMTIHQQKMAAACPSVHNRVHIHTSLTAGWKESGTPSLSGVCRAKHDTHSITLCAGLLHLYMPMLMHPPSPGVDVHSTPSALLGLHLTSKLYKGRRGHLLRPHALGAPEHLQVHPSSAQGPLFAVSTAGLNHGHCAGQLAACA